MENIKVYQRKRINNEKEKEKLHLYRNWVPETPLKPATVKPICVYIKRSLTCGSRRSFLSRISKEADANKDEIVVAFAGEQDEKEHSSPSSELSCLKSDGSLDLNKGICSRGDVASSESDCNGGDSNAADCCVSLELSLAPASECAISNDENLTEPKTQGSHITPPVECAANSLPLTDEQINLKSHITECDRKKDSQLEDVYPANLEPQTPAIKHNKRPRNGDSTDVRSAKKRKYRPKVEDGRVKKSASKKEKTKPSRITRPQKKEKKKLVPKNLTPAMMSENLEVPDNVAATLNLNLERKSTVESDVGEQKHEGNLLSIPDLNFKVKLTEQFDMADNTCAAVVENGCQYVLRDRGPKMVELDWDSTDFSGHKQVCEGKVCVKDCLEHISLPKRCKKRRTKRKRRRKVSIASVYFLLRGHLKKKRSRSVRRGKMVPRVVVDELVSFFGRLVLNSQPKMESNDDQRMVTENFSDMRQVPVYYDLRIDSLFEQNLIQLIDKSTGIHVGYIHEDSITSGSYQSSLPIQAGSIVPIQDTFSLEKGAMVLHQSSIQEGAIVPHRDSSSSEKAAIVLHQRRPKKFKPIIDIDDESIRRWTMIKRKEEGLGEEEEQADEETRRKWEEDVTWFRQQIDLFNKIMHEVLGDRRFKPWKGSVVDSVIGVFLTQNVSDFLSSSAYMALAAKFPKETSNQEEEISSQESIGSTNGTRGVSQYFVTDVAEDEGSLCDIEDIGKPNLPRGTRTPNPLTSSEMMHCSEAFSDFCQNFSGSISPCHGENSGITGDFLAENMSSDKELPNMPVLPQDCSSQGEVVIEKNLNCECNSQIGGGMPKSSDFIDKSCFNEAAKTVVQDKAPSEESGKTVMQDKPPAEEAGKATPKKKAAMKKEVEKKDWDSLRKKYSIPRLSDHTDSINWEAVRQADVNVIAETIKSRGQQTILADRIKGFLNRVVELHGSIDLEWLRFAPPMIVKEYLLDFEGLGLKSVECIRLLELGHIAFPVDVNVARILVRLGWVPLKPLPGNLLFHLLEEYPIMDNVQKYVWPRLCGFNPEFLYEFHYHLITFGKIFCKKRSPNCNSCPLKAECRHFASTVAASANLHLPAPTSKDSEKSIVPGVPILDFQPPSDNEVAVTLDQGLEISNCVPSSEEPILPGQGLTIKEFEEFGLTSDLEFVTSSCVPSVEEPKSPEQEQNHKENLEFEDNYSIIADDIQLTDDGQEEEIPVIRLNNKVFKENVLFYWEKYHGNLQEGDGKASKALVPLSMDVNLFLVPKLKRTNHLRTEHQVYEIPDGHDLLIGFERRDSEDSVPYLLAIWTAGETPNSVEQPKKKCNSQGSELCNDLTCFACQSICEGNADVIRGTILIPCRTAMRARFPLNGTYFQVNEVFADHETSHEPLIIPRSSIWYLERRMVFFGTSPSAIFTKDCSLTEIQKNFWTGFICLRGFDRKTRAPKPLAPRFHCSPSKMEKTPRKRQSQQDEKSARRVELGERK